MLPAPTLAAFGLGGGELVIILLIILLLFGGAKLPSLAKGLGQSIKEFKKASKDDEPGAAKSSAPNGAEAKKNEPAGTPGSN